MDAEPLALLGEVLYQDERFAEALWALKQAVALNPKQAHCYRLLGRIYEHEGRSKEAEEMFHAAQSIGPEHCAAGE